MQKLLTPKWMLVKAILFVVIAISSAALVFVQNPSWSTGALLALVAWASSRAYYFAFYVVEHYVDSSFRFSGLTDFAVWLLRRNRRSSR